MTGMADAAFEVAKNPDAAKKDALARHPAGRFGDPKDIAAIRQLEEEYGQQWPQYWLRKRGIKTPLLQEL